MQQITYTGLTNKHEKFILELWPEKIEENELID